MALLFNKLNLRQLVKVPVRHGHGKDHWSKVKKKKTAKDLALKHFDEFYGNVYGDMWPDVRTALLREQPKYMAIINNFSDTERIQSDLEQLGAVNLRNLYNIRKENVEFFESKRKAKRKESQRKQCPTEIETSKDELTEIQTIYRGDYANIETVKAEDTELVKKEGPIPIKLESIDKELTEICLDTNRIIDPSVNISMLHEYVPATKIKGLDDWVLESDHYKFYTKDDDFNIVVEKECVLPFPKHLHAYTFERGNNSRFPNPKKGSTGVLDYYLFDGSSILPVLALDLQLGDVVLDMCAAPGGKALTILQTLMPRLLVVNDVMKSRVKSIQNVIDTFVSDICSKENMLLITELDARAINEKDIYNKILVDVPCTTDRHILHSDDKNIFKPNRIKERLRMPELQSEILTNALKLVSVGGTVVYSTCTLSPIQNDGVVQVSLKKAWEECDSIMVVKDMTEALLPLQYIYEFGNIGTKYGHIIIPIPQNNWGPIYFCKIKRVQ